MDPITAAAATTAVTSALAAVTATGDISGVVDLIKGFSSAASEGNYWWIISMSVFMLLELAKGRVPGTKIVIPQIPALLDGKLSAQAKKGIVLGLSGAIAIVFVISGRPVDAAVADFAQGWIGAMGLHGAAGMVRDLIPRKNKDG